jgi:hypothetical protein
MCNTIGDPDSLRREIAEFNDRLASPSANFAAELHTESELYSADGVLFSALVHFIRVEEDLLNWGWHPERVRTFGLEINFDEDLAWPITRDWVTINDHRGNTREFYRLTS